MLIKTSLLALFGLLVANLVQAYGFVPPQCVQARIHHVPCVAGMTYNNNLTNSAQVPVSGPSKYLPWQGNSTASVHSQYPAVINYEFVHESGHVLDVQIAKMSDLELARFSHQYYIATHGNIIPLMRAMAWKLNITSLIRMRKVFGDALDIGINGQASHTIQAQYYAWIGNTGGPVIRQSHAQYVQERRFAMTMNGAASGVAAPTPEMTLYEIYTEFLFTEAETTMGALAQTAWYAKSQLGTAFVTGYSIGSAFYAFASWVNPDYGYDLTTLYGDYMAGDFGPIDGGITGTVTVGEPFSSIGVWEFCGC